MNIAWSHRFSARTGYLSGSSRWWRSASLALLSGSIWLLAAVAMTQPVTACGAAVRPLFSSRGAFSRDRAVPRRACVTHVPGVGCQCRRPVPFGVRSRTKGPWPDVMPGRFTGAVFVAEEKRLGAGFRCRRRATLSDLRRRGG
jgi:hypothetical protein